MHPEQFLLEILTVALPLRTCNSAILRISEDPNIILIIIVTITGWGVHLMHTAPFRL